MDLSVCSICLFPGAQYPAGNSLEGHGPEHRSWDPPATLASLQTSLNKKPRLLQNSPEPASPCHRAGDGRPAAERGWRRRGRVHQFPSWRHFQFSMWNVSLNPSNLRAISRRPAAPKSSSCSGRDKPQLPTRPTRPTQLTCPTCPTRPTQPAQPTRPEARWERSARRATRRRGCGHVTPGVKAGAAIALRESVSPARGALALSRGDGRAGRPGGASAATRRVGENRPGHPVDSAQSRCFLSFLRAEGGLRGAEHAPGHVGSWGPPRLATLPLATHRPSHPPGVPEVIGVWIRPPHTPLSSMRWGRGGAPSLAVRAQRTPALPPSSPVGTQPFTPSFLGVSP